jgi:hypothetical protein
MISQGLECEKLLVKTNCEIGKDMDGLDRSMMFVLLAGRRFFKGPGVTWKRR